MISVGEGNDYGHPTQGSLDALVTAGVQIYRTDDQVTIVATSVVIDSIDLSSEVVTIRSAGSTAVDLSGWKLVSEVGTQTYVFPAGTQLVAGSTLEIAS